MRDQTNRVTSFEHGEGKEGQALDADKRTKLHFVTGWIGVVTVFLLTLITCYEVVSRYVFGSPTIWVTESSGYILVGLAAIGAAYANYERAHIRVDLLLDRLSDRVRVLLEQGAVWVAFAFVAITAWQIALKVYADYVNGARFWGLLEVPKWIPETPLFLGFGLLAISLVQEAQAIEGTTPNKRKRTVGFIGAVTSIFALIAMGAIEAGGVAPAIGGIDTSLLAILVLSAGLSLGINGVPAFSMVVALYGVCAIVMSMFHDVSPLGLLGVIVAILLAMLLLGVRVAFALGSVGVLGIFLLLPQGQGRAIAERVFTSLNSFELTAVPMFVLMGTLLLRSGVSTRMFDAVMKWVGRLPGGIAHASVGACALFAAVSGSSVATAATMGTIARPEMLKRQYSARLTYGSVAAGGTIGILIPPSVPMIVYGAAVGASVTSLFIAGIIPGILITAAFVAVVGIWSIISPESAPRGPVSKTQDKIKALWGILPFVALIALILGSLYAGVATPTEAGAVGAFLAFVLSTFRGEISVKSLIDCGLETTKVSSFVLLIIAATSVLTYSLDFLEIPQSSVDGINALGLSPLGIICVVFLIYVLLGMFIDPISMMLITLPITFPLVTQSGFDPIWFGVALVVMIEIALITPPIGINLFVLRGMSGDVPMSRIVTGAAPFLLAMIAILGILVAFPGIVTWLPSTTK